MTKFRSDARLHAMAFLVGLAACGEGANAPTNGDASPPGNTDQAIPAVPEGGSADSGPRPPSSPSKSGWQKSFNAKSASVNCNQTLDQMKAAGASTLTIGSSTLVVGYEQIGQNQDPVFARFDDGTKKYCEHHEREPPDGRAYGVTWDGGKIAYVAYTIVGGGSAFDGKAKGQWLDRYGDGGGSSAVAFLGEVETDLGTLNKGTFVIAKKQDGKTNSHKPADAPIVLPDGRIELQGDSAFQPMNPDKSIMECTGYPFYTRYVFSADLKTLTCSSSTSCRSAVPCGG